MKRVNKGEKYWYLRGNLEVAPAEETGSIFDLSTYLNLDYFHTKEEAESMLKKLRAVLKGADVIEMPSEEEIITTISGLKHEKDLDDGETPNAGLYDIGFDEAIYWLKSKIVK